MGLDSFKNLEKSEALKVMFKFQHLCPLPCSEYCLKVSLYLVLHKEKELHIWRTSTVWLEYQETYLKETCKKLHMVHGEYKNKQSRLTSCNLVQF